MNCVSRSVIVALALVACVGAPQVALASAPTPTERPGDQYGGAAASAVERERRYAGLSLGEAVRQALIDDDLDFAFSTMSAVGQSAGDGAGASYFRALRAFARADFVESNDSLNESKSDDMLVAAVRTWSLAAAGKSEEAAKVWDIYGDSGQKPFYAAYRAALAEYSGDTDMALRQYKIADSVGELLFAEDLARRYAVLLVKSGQTRDALKMHDVIFGADPTLNAQERAFRQTLVSETPADPGKIDPRAIVSRMMSNFADATQFARVMQRKEAADSTVTAGKAKAGQADSDSMFVNDGLILRSALLIDPANSDARLSLAQVLSDNDEDNAARETLEQAKEGPMWGKTRLMLASVYGSLENPKKGLDILDALPESEREGEWWSKRADLLAARGQFKESHQAVERGIVFGKGKGLWIEQLGQVARIHSLASLGQRDEARRLAVMLLPKLGTDNPLRGSLAPLLLRTPSTKARGLAAARSALKTVTADHHTKAYVGTLLAQFPQTRSEGIGLMRQALSELPRSPSLMNSLGFSLVTYDIDLDEGFTLLQKAHDLRPESGAIMDSLGVAHYKLGNLDEAQKLIERAVAIRIDSPDPEIYDHLGDVYWHQGRKDDARTQWRKAQDLGGNYEGADDLIQKLRNGLTGPPPAKRAIPVIAEPGSV